MQLSELESTAVLENLPAALERAARDMPEAERKFKAAEANLAKAESERQRGQKVFGSLNAKIALLWDRQKAAKLRAMQSSVMELDDLRAWKDYEQLKSERLRVIDCFHFVSLFTMEDANRNYILAELAEREAYADWIESRITAQRLALASAASAAMEFDPGARISFTDRDGAAASWSEAERLKIADIRGGVCPELRSRLADHDRRVNEQRALAGNLWS